MKNSEHLSRALVFHALRHAFTVSTFVMILTALCLPASAQSKVVWSAQEQPIVDQLHTIRDVPDDKRPAVTRQLALDIRKLPPTPNKVRLADGLASRATEGDFGHNTLQEVATTLAEALRQQPQPGKDGQPADAYLELAQLMRYEHIDVSLDDPQLKTAMATLEAADEHRQTVNFTLTDLDGKSWTLKDLHGKVVLVNFWATWCPPCRKEMPDLEALYKKFAEQGFVVLAISDEESDKVKPFITERQISYPILLDPGRKVTQEFQVDGIPKSFIYDRQGKLVAQSIDMRTQKQFLEMLALAGLQ